MSTQKRHFTIEGAYHTDGCPTKFKGKSGSGRFTSQRPANSAAKALSSLCQRKKIKGRCSMYVVVRETTQGSTHKKYAYLARRHKKTDPSPMGHKYSISLKKIPLDTLEKKTCKKSKKSSGRMKSKYSKKLPKRKYKGTKK